MFANILSLEAAKQKKTLYSTYLVFLLAIVAVAVESFWRGRNPLEALSALPQLAVLALPLLSLLFGVLAASGLRDSQRRAAEEPLPFHPAGKALGSYVVSLAFLALTAAAFAAARIPVGSMNWIDSWYVIPVALSLLILHSYGFTFTYWLGQPVLGAGLALLLCGLGIGCMVGLIHLNDFPMYTLDWESLFTYFGVVTGLSWLLSLAALVLLSGPVERQARMKLRIVPVLGFLSFGIALGAIALQQRVSDLETRLYPYNSFRWIWEQQDTPEYDLWRTPLFTTRTGSLVHLRPDGGTKVIYRASGLNPFASKAMSAFTVDIQVDRNEVLWLLVVPDKEHKDQYEILHAGPGQVASGYTTFRAEDIRPQTLVARNGRLALCGSKQDTGEDYCADLPERGKMPQWIAVPGNGDPSMFAWRRQLALTGVPNVARVSDHEHTLVLPLPDGTERRWNLPGPATENLKIDLLMPSFFRNGEPAFATAVAEADGTQRLIVCDPDGSVEDPWNRTWGKSTLRRRVIPGGTIWGTGDWKRPEFLVALGSDGQAFPPVAIKDLYRDAGVSFPDPQKDIPRVVPLQINGSRIRLIVQGVLIEYDLVAQHLERKLGILTKENVFDSVSIMNTTDGVYFIRDDRIRLMDWTGVEKDLGPAKLPGA